LTFAQYDLIIMRFDSLKISLFTAIALLCFAANSVLNRLALGSDSIDACSYVGIRLVAGALTLWLIHGFSHQNFSVKFPPLSKGLSLLPAFYLFCYGLTFSLAYRSLASGTGAFLLFGTVQTTMLSVLLLRGERPKVSEWLGLLIAILGLIYLIFPGLSAPEPRGALLMIIAGVSWAFYTLSGKGVQNPLLVTTQNFLFSTPMILIINILNLSKSYFSTEGILYAIASGAIASGLGYTIWYAALKGLTTTQAALLQLTVPVIAAFGGVFFLSEMVTQRLVIAGTLILSGVILALLKKH
jgi:drug/metabolite transporter (DMT)-like permease